MSLEIHYYEAGATDTTPSTIVNKNKLLDDYKEGKLQSTTDVWIAGWDNWENLRNCYNKLGITNNEYESAIREKQGKVKMSTEMTKKEQNAVTLLGWSLNSWDEGEDVTPFTTFTTKLSSFTQSHKDAAVLLGYLSTDFTDGVDSSAETADSTVHLQLEEQRDESNYIISNMTKCLKKFQTAIKTCEPEYTQNVPDNQAREMKKKYTQYNIFLDQALQQLPTSSEESELNPDKGQSVGGKSVIKVIPKKQKKQIRRLYKGPRGGKYYKRKDKKIYVK